MAINTRRNFFGKIAAMTAVVTGASKLFAQQAPAVGASTTGNATRGARQMRLVAPAAAITRTTESTISLAPVPTTDIPRKITFW